MNEISESTTIDKSTEEFATILDALGDAEETATRIIASMDRSHEFMQDIIRDLRATNDLLSASNAAALPRKESDRSVDVAERYAVAPA
jgi:hypothetical protein